MRARFVGSGIVGAAVLCAMSVLFVSAPRAQNPPPGKDPAAKPTPRMPDGHPDFSGFYNGNDVYYHQAAGTDETFGHVFSKTADGNIFLDFYGASGGTNLLLAAKENTNQPSYKPEWMAKVDQVAKTMWGGQSNLDPENMCKPEGVPRSGFGEGGVMQVVQSAQVVAIMYEQVPGPFYRLIYTDGRQHPKDLDTSYMGHSIGHWDGDTLVVDTVGLNDETWLGGQSGDEKGQGANNHTSLHSDQEHVIERWTRNGDVIAVTAVVEDPVALAQPWVLRPKRVRIGQEGDYIQPEMCVPKNEGHIVPPSAKNPQVICGWCNSERLYGIDSDKVTADGVEQRIEKRTKGEPELPPSRSGGGE